MTLKYLITVSVIEGSHTEEALVDEIAESTSLQQRNCICLRRWEP